MKKTYAAPTVIVDEAEADCPLMVTSILLSDDGGNEQFAKEQAAEAGGWDIDW